MKYHTGNFYNYIFIFLWTLVLANTHGQKKIKFKHLGYEQGLPGVSVQCAYQDTKGIMWLGVESSGLCRYDGNSFETFTSVNDISTSITNNFVSTIIEDVEGDLWVGTLDGLNKFNAQNYTFERFYHSDDDSTSIVGNYFTNSCRDRFGNIWFTTQQGLTIYNPQKKAFYNLLRGQDLLSVYNSSENMIYVGSSNKGIYIFSDRENLLFNEMWIESSTAQPTLDLTPSIHYEPFIMPSINNSQNAIWSFAEDLTNNTMIIGTSNGLYKYFPALKSFEKIHFAEPEFEVLNICTYGDIYIDKNRVLWAGSTSDGLLYLDLKNNSFQYLSPKYNPFSPIQSNSIRTIYSDNSQMIWIASKFNGMYIYDRRQEQFSHITKSTQPNRGLNDKYTMCFYEDKKGNIWIGTKNGGLNKLNPQTNLFTYYKYYPYNKSKSSLSNNRIQDIKEGDNNILWLGTETGLEKFNMETGKSQSIGYRNINTFIVGKNKLWVGSFSGIECFDIKKGIFYKPNSKHNILFNNTNMPISQMIKGKNNSIWIASNFNGVFHYYIDSDSLVHYKHKPNDSTTISGNMIRGLFIDNHGTLWVGTKSYGLNKYNEATNTFVHIKSSLSTRTIYSIKEDSKHNLWMGTHNGIIKYSIDQDSITNFNMDYGLQGSAFETNASYTLKNGLMLFGGQNGFNIFDPNHVVKHYCIAPLVISKFKVFDKIQARNINKHQSYTLNRRSNYITFEFALLDYSKPSQNQYAYRLVPFDKDWIYCGNRSYASYTNLPSGSYKFMVKGSNLDGDWNEEGLSIDINIPASLWEKAWFKITVSLLTILLIFLLILIKIQAAKAKEKRLKVLVNERTRALSIANQELRKKGRHISWQNKELLEHRNNLEKLVKDRTSDLEKAKEKAEESDRLKSSFLANMSHEIRTPLNAIMGFSSLIATNQFDKGEIEIMNEVIQSNGKALIQLINDIIDISLIEANQLEIMKCDFRLNYFLKALCYNFSSQIKLLQDKDLEVILSIPQELRNDEFIINTDQERLRQILTNLFSNALKFTNKGCIKFGYILPDDKKSIHFFMEDTGIGIKEKYLNEIFRRFIKIEHNTSSLHRGTGLGLSICSNLIKLLNGEIYVESEFGKGTRFSFTLQCTLKRVDNLWLRKIEDEK